MIQSRLPTPYHQHGLQTSIPTPLSHHRISQTSHGQQPKCPSASSSRSTSPSHSFIPTPRSAQRSSATEKQINSASCGGGAPKVGVRSAAVASPYSSQATSAVNHVGNKNSMLDKLKLFNHKDKSRQGNGGGPKRTSSSSGVSSTKSERSDSSNSIHSDSKNSDKKESEVTEKAVVRRKQPGKESRLARPTRPLSSGKTATSQLPVANIQQQQQQTVPSCQQITATAQVTVQVAQIVPPQCETPVSLNYSSQPQEQSSLNKDSVNTGMELLSAEQQRLCSGIPKPTAVVKSYSRTTLSVTPLPPRSLSPCKIQEEDENMKESSLDDGLDPTVLMGVKPMEPLLQQYKSNSALPRNSPQDRNRAMRGVGTYPLRSSTEANFTEFSNLNHSSGYMSDSDMRVVTNRCDISDGYMSENDAAALYHRLQSQRGIPSVGNNFKFEQRNQLSGFNSDKFRNNSLLLVREGAKVSNDSVELSSSENHHPKIVKLLNGSSGGGREGPPPSQREGVAPGGPASHQVVYRVVSSKHVKKSDSSQQTDTSAFRQASSVTQWKGGGQSDPRLRDKQRSGASPQPASQTVPQNIAQNIPTSASLPLHSNGITHRNKSDKKRIPSSGSREELESDSCNGGDKVIRNGLSNGSTGKIISSSGKAKTRDASSANTPSYNYPKRPQANGSTKEQRTSAQPVSRTKVKVSGGTQTESGYSGRGPAIGSVGKVGPAPSGGIGSNVTASGRFLPPDFAERDFPDVPNRTITPREYSESSSNRPGPGRDFSDSPSSRTMPDYAELSPYSSGWLRHTSPYNAHSLPTRSSASGVLVEADSIESLPAQLQHRASLTHSRILGAASTAPRISRSNSIRSTKSEKLYPSMLERSDETEPYYSIPYSLGHSQPTSPTPTHLSRFNYPISPVSTGSGSASRPPQQYSSKLNNKDDDVHGSAVSLVSTTSSLYSTTEEKQAHEVRKLKKELNDSQEKVQALTRQLSTNAHVVSAFEQSLSSMTQRLEKKDTELIELRQTIELMRATQTQPDATDSGRSNELGAPRRHTLASEPDAPISRQLSTDSVSSLSSTCSLSSNNHHADCADKKKKRGWLRSSFNKAFSRTKKNKSGGSVDGGDDMRSELSSAPPSPLLPHHPLSQDHSPVSSSPNALTLEKDNGYGGESVEELRRQLREKDLVLTDIRLEALSSAHQLESLKDTVFKMKNEMHSLKQDNERLQRLVTSKSLTSSQNSLTRNSEDVIERRFSMNDALTAADVKYDMFCGDPDGKRVVVSVVSSNNIISESSTSWPIATVSISGKTKWDMLDAIIRRIFKDYLERIDPSGSLGLTTDSMISYEIGEVTRLNDSSVPELLPCGYLVGETLSIKIRLHGPSDNSLDSLAFETLVPKSILQRYVSLLTEYKRIILCGPSGTGKTYIANKIAEYLAARVKKPIPEAIATFNVESKSNKELRQYLTHVGEQCESEGGNDLPSVIILDNLHLAGPLQEVFQGFLQARLNQNQPYIIGTMAQTTSHTTNLQLHHNFRWILCANHMEPVKGLLGRYLRRREIEASVKAGAICPELARLVDWLPRVWSHLNTFLESHSTCDVTLGPRLFLQCPMDPHSSQVWFTDLWNYSIIPYAVDAVRDGIQNYGKRTQFHDPASYLLQTYPWSHKHNQPLMRMRPEDVGYDPQPNAVISSNSLKSTGGAGDCHNDPLMNMVMRLQEAANYSGPQNNDSDSNANSDALESTDFDPTL